ncbi:hypothetical protein GCM10029978_113380 [Actinoallomurus acanthiterrae]
MQLGVSPLPADVGLLRVWPLPVAPEEEAGGADAVEPDDESGEFPDADALPLKLQALSARTAIPPPQARTAAVRRRLSSIGTASSYIYLFANYWVRCPQWEYEFAVIPN